MSGCSCDHEGRTIWIAEAYPSALEGLLVDSHNAGERDEEDVDEYFGDNFVKDEHD